MPSEDGWEPAQASTDQCEWITVPGTSVSLQLLKGQPLTILRAFAADFNAYVEPLRDADSAGWTPTNSVPTSNHLNGTAMDLNWNSHRFQISYDGFSADQIATCRELLDWYEGTIQWGQDWGGDPYDCMHWNMGYNTYQNPHTQDFINRKIRADGFSTFRRSGQPTPPPPGPSEMTVPLVENPNGTWTSPSPAWAHLIMRESSGNPTIIQQIIDVNSGGNEAEGLFQITPATWRAHNGTEFAPSPRLATPQQQAIVAARIFTQNPSGGDWGAGLPGREDAAQLAAGLVPIEPPQSGDDMAAVPQEQWDELFKEICGQASSQSPFRALNEGAIWRPSQMWLNDDGMTHPQFVEWAAGRGDPRSLARLNELAAADATKYPDRADDIVLAQQVLARLTAPAQSQPPAAPPVSLPPTVVPPAPAAPTPSGTNSIGPAGWVGIAGVVLQGVLWLLQQSLSVLPPQWAGVASGVLAGATAIGIYKAPAQTPKTAAPAPAEPAPTPLPEPPPPAPLPPAPPPSYAAPQPEPEPAPEAGSIADMLKRTQNDAAELADKANQINKSLE